jgi:hypothetical protein
VNKTKPGLEAKVKAAEAVKLGAEDPAEAEDAAAFKQDLKKQMMSALAQVKARAPEELEQQQDPKPQLQFMAYLAGTGCAVVVARRVGSSTKPLLEEIGGGASGGKFVQGECVFEKNSHTFVLQEVPSGLARKLAAALHTETGQKYKVRVRNTDGSLTLDADTDLDADKTQAPPHDAPVAGAEEMAKFTERFKALQPDMLKAIATKTSHGDTIKQRASEAGALANKGNLPQAHQVLDSLETLLKNPPAAPPGKDPGAAPRELKLSAYMGATRDWKEAKKAAANGVFALKNAIFAACDPEMKEPVKARIDSLNSVFGPMDDAIIAMIQAAGSEADAERQAERNREVVKFANTVLDALRKHPLAPVADVNPFGTFTICSPVETVLNKFTTVFAV